MSEIAADRTQSRSVEVRLAILCGIYAAIAVLIEPRFYLLNVAKYTPSFLGAVPIFCFFGLISSAVVLRPRSPLTFILEILKERGTTALATALLCWAGIAAFWTFKFHIPDLVPFYSDPILADLDDAIHFGTPG